MGVLTDKDLSKIVNKRDLVIWPFEDSCITGLGYDLKIGCIYPLSEFNGFSEAEGKIVIPPRCYCIIITKEFIWLSGKLVGTLHARGTLAAKGLYTNSTNIDPNFRGQMIISAVNLSNANIVLHKEDTFITMILHEAATPTKMLVGTEGTKNSTRVTEQMSGEIYSEASEGGGENYSRERESVSKLHLFFTKSNHAHLPVFDNLIKEAQNRGVVDTITEKGRRLISSYGGSTKGIAVNVITIAAYVLSFYIVVVLGLEVLRKDGIDKTDWRIIALLLVAILGLINSLHSSKKS